MFSAPSALLLCCLLTLLPLPALGASSSDVNMELDIDASYRSNENYLQHDGLAIRHLHFTRDRYYKLVNIHPSLSFTSDNHFSGYLGADLTWESPVDEDAYDELEAEFTTAYISLKGEHVRTDIGLQWVQFGNALIMAEDVPAAAIHADFGDGYAEFKGALAMDSSPIVGLTLGYRPDYFERVEVFGIRYSDQDNAFADTMPIIFNLFDDLDSKGTLNYYGVSADLFIGDTLLSLVGAYQSGEFTLNRNTDGLTSKTNVRAWFGDISLEKNLSQWWSVSLFCYFSSGDKSPLQGDLNAFVAVWPYNPRAAIFFDPDFKDIGDTERLTFSSGYIYGVIAPGIKVSFISDWGLSAEAALINLYADQKLDNGDRWYGWEADFEVSYTLRDQYRLFIEAARFEHGDNFETLLNESIDPAVSLTVGIHASF